MKRYAVILLFIQIYLLIMPISVQAATIWEPPRTTQQSYQLIFLRVRDEYQLRYALNGLPPGTHQVRANFWSTTGTYYDAVFDSPTGIAYLTCNGIYIFEMLNTSGQTIAETKQIVTHKIEQPACRSYENGGIRNDLNARYEGDANGIGAIDFDPIPTTIRYMIDKDGEGYKTLTSITQTGFDTNGPGIYTITAVDNDGNVLASSDVIVGGGGTTGIDGNDNSGGTDPDETESCATLICQCIAELKTALGDKFDSLNNNVVMLKPVLDGIKSNLDQQLLDNDQIIEQLHDVNDELDAITDHLTPSSDPVINEQPNLQLDNFTPNIEVPRQTDDTTYFQDTGEASDPGVLPPIADPSFDWSDGETIVSPTDPLEPEEPLTVEEALTPMEALIPDEPLQPETELDWPLRWKSQENQH